VRSGWEDKAREEQWPQSTLSLSLSLSLSATAVAALHGRRRRPPLRHIRREGR
jgi:hypothetical protein